ncbi:unnamed protein product [Symbiodinium natans]|uniref:Uncharacterized protein n=1 Tax=Symbiodinium natans TaxID=878477 RepID=A0A812Q4V6_9DINO|nr:unnamed protein product [Symbiodinium natans]
MLKLSPIHRLYGSVHWYGVPAPDADSFDCSGVIKNLQLLRVTWSASPDILALTSASTSAEHLRAAGVIAGPAASPHHAAQRGLEPAPGNVNAVQSRRGTMPAAGSRVSGADLQRFAQVGGRTGDAGQRAHRPTEVSGREPRRTAAGRARRTACCCW